MIKRRILYQPWGGLGDNLQYSTLPKKFTELGVDFYISHLNNYRNPEIYELVWGLNPYVKGIEYNEGYNTGDIAFNRKYTDKSIVYNQEESHGLTPTNEIPEIYYKPNNITELNDTILLDLNSVSLKAVIPADLIDIIKNKYPDKSIIIPVFNTKLANNIHSINVQHDSTIQVTSIFHYCDLINSCHHFICSFSGQSVLASALNKKETTCFMGSLQSGSPYVFPNINYEVVNQL